VRFVMYTDKTVAQALEAITERLHTKGTRTRPQLDGGVEKSGRFTIEVKTRVYGRFPRKTVLRAQAERESGTTIVRGTVPGGLSRRHQLLVFAIMVIIAGIGWGQGSALLAGVAVIAGAAFFIPLQGDYENAEILLTELQRALQAKFTPPKN
jgi:hypothetical protein